jgi:hypothetical protein
MVYHFQIIKIGFNIWKIVVPNITIGFFVNRECLMTQGHLLCIDTTRQQQNNEGDKAFSRFHVFVNLGLTKIFIRYLVENSLQIYKKNNFIFAKQA